MKKIGSILLISIGILTSSVVTSYAFFGFGGFLGGTVHDILTEIKDAVIHEKEIAKLKEITAIQKIKKAMQEDYKAYMAYKNDIETIQKSILGLRSTSIDALKSTHTLSQEAEELFRINESKSISENFTKVRGGVSRENGSIISASQANSKAMKELEDKKQKILSDYASGVIGEKQKQILLSGIEVEYERLATSLEAQDSMRENKLYFEGKTEETLKGINAAPLRVEFK